MNRLFRTRRAASTLEGRHRAAAIRAAAPTVLRETKNPAVMWGDCGLLDDIAERAGFDLIARHPMLRHRIVLDALDLCMELVPGMTIAGQSREVRIFWLPEEAPARYIIVVQGGPLASTVVARRHAQRWLRTPAALGYVLTECLDAPPVIAWNEEIFHLADLQAGR